VAADSARRNNPASLSVCVQTPPRGDVARVDIGRQAIYRNATCDIFLLHNKLHVVVFESAGTEKVLNNNCAVPGAVLFMLRADAKAAKEDGYAFCYA